MNDQIKYLQRQIMLAKNVGRAGELLVERLVAPAWTVTERRKHGGADMRLVNQETGEALHVEVKTSKRGKEGYQFCLRRYGKTAHTDIAHADVVVLLCVDKSGLITPFVIPARLMTGLKFSIKSFAWEYQGKYAPYRQSLHKFDLEGYRCLSVMH